MAVDPSFLDSVSLGSVSVLATMASGGAGLAWWLSSQFNRMKSSVMDELKWHEEKDQKRHEDNIQRFAVIETLIKNGAH